LGIEGKIVLLAARKRQGATAVIASKEARSRRIIAGKVGGGNERGYQNYS
jgi:hypothetical protein